MPSERPKASPAEAVRHARRRIARIFAVTRDDTLESYLANEERQESVERNFIGIGEAIKDLARSAGAHATWTDRYALYWAGIGR